MLVVQVRRDCCKTLSRREQPTMRSVSQAQSVAVDFDMQEEMLDLTWQLIGDAGAEKLAKKLPKSACRHLILTKNEVYPENVATVIWS